MAHYPLGELGGFHDPASVLGIDHECFTFRFQGRQFRLTDVHGVMTLGSPPLLSTTLIWTFGLAAYSRASRRTVCWARKCMSASFSALVSRPVFSNRSIE